MAIFDGHSDYFHGGRAIAWTPKIVASWETLDLAKIEPCYATDPDLTYFDLAPLKYDNRAEYRATVAKVLFEPNRSVKLNDLRVHLRGSLAWAAFTFAADVTSKQGATSRLDGRWTMGSKGADRAGARLRSPQRCLVVRRLRMEDSQHGL